MPITDDTLLKRLLVTFKAEAQEHIHAIAAGLIALEQTTSAEAQAAALDPIFRAAHSLKGAARTVNVTDIETLCQSLESTFAALKRGLIVASPELFDLLHRAAAALDAGAVNASPAAEFSASLPVPLPSLR